MSDQKSDDGILSTYILGDAPQGERFVTVFCPLREEPRSSILCERVCANTGWSDKKAKETRSSCPAWEEIKAHEQD